MLGPGRRLGPYEISGPLGRGGMGEVFRARDTRLGRDVAVKSLPVEFAADPERLGRFQREARVLASLNHPNVASIYGLEQSDGESFLVLECVEGETLAARLAGGPLPVDEAIRVCAEIAAGVGAAHDAGIIHRDLKPGNVMLRPDGAVKVLDFGLAKATEPAGGAGASVSGSASRSPTITAGTEAGVILGTAAYMSPEQARGRALDKRSDIFSFGCILYECLTGKRAFPGERVSDTLSAIVADEPDWTALPSAVPPRVLALLRRCLQKDPRRRLHDVADARLELEEALSPPPGGDVVVAAWPAPASRNRTRGRALAWLAAGALGGAAAAAAFFTSRGTPARAAGVPTIQAVIPLPDGVRFNPAGRPGLAISPGGETLVFCGTQGGVPRLYRRRLDGGEAVAIPGTEGGTQPFFSPDGAWLGYFTPTEIRKVPAAGGSPVRVCGAPPVAQGGTWAPDGTILFSRTPNGGLFRVSERGGKSEPFSTLASGEHAHRWPQALPGGKGTLVAIVRGVDFQDIDSSEIVVLEPGSLRRRPVLEGSSFAQYVEPGRLVFVRGNNLFTAPFDLASLRTTGTPVPMPDGASIEALSGVAHFGAGGGALVVATGPPLKRMATSVLVVGRTGSGTPLPLPAARYTHPRLSPDRKQLVVLKWDRAVGKLVLLDRARQVVTILTPEPGRFFSPVWSPDGRTLAFTRLHMGEPRLAMKSTDGAGEIQYPVADLKRAEFPSSWSPDGHAIAYTVNNDLEGDGSHATSDIWMLTLVPKPEIRAWLAGPHTEFGPFFSPDGRRIAYVSDESGKNEVYVRPYPGPGPRTKISRDGGAEPAWTRGGREIVYRSGDEFLSVELAADGTPLPGAPRVLFSGRFVEGGREDYPREYDVSADGEEFVVIQGERAPEVVRQLTVTTPWPPAPPASPQR